MKAPMLALVLAVAVFPAHAEPKPAGSRAERGAYLVKMMGCNDCHTPWKKADAGAEPDMSRELSRGSICARRAIAEVATCLSAILPRDARPHSIANGND